MLKNAIEIRSEITEAKIHSSDHNESKNSRDIYKERLQRYIVGD